MKSVEQKTPVVVLKTAHHVKSNLAIIDIDEILGDFQEIFCRYVQGILKRPWILEAGQYGLEAGLIKEFSKGQKMIDEFYQSNRLMDLPVIPGSQDFMKFLKSMNFTLWAVTGRPGHKYPRTVPDTVKWLIKNGFEFDRYVFTRAKGNYLRKYTQPLSTGTVISLEDSATHSDDMADCVNTSYLRNRHYNIRPVEDDKLNCVRFDTFDEVQDDIIKHAIEYGNDFEALYV